MRKLLRSADVKRFILVSMLLFWCACLIAVRIIRTGSGYYRFLRWNGWDVLVDPTRLFDMMGAAVHPWAHMQAVSVTLIFGVILTLGYITLRVLLANPERT